MGCVAGALEVAEFERLLTEAGFVEVSIEPTRVYSASDASDLLAQLGDQAPALAVAAEGKFASAFVRGRKP